MFGNNYFKDQKGRSSRQIVLLLGPIRGGKTELLYAVRDLRKIGESKLAKIDANHQDPRYSKADAKATHSETTTPIKVPLSSKIRLFLASLFFKDGGGEAGRQLERIHEFLDKHIKPRPTRWRDGVLCVVVFDMCDIVGNDEAKKMDIEASYRDALEAWGKEFYPLEEEEVYQSLEDNMKGKRKPKKKSLFRPPLGVLFLGSHLDVAQKGGVEDSARQSVDAFVRDMEGNAGTLLSLPNDMEIPPSRTVFADLKSMDGRLQFIKDFYKARRELTDVMKEG